MSVPSAVHQPGDTISMSDNTVLYAVWEAEAADEDDEISLMCISMGGMVALLLMRRRREM